MSRGPAIHTQANIARALRAADQVGPRKWRVRVGRDEIFIEPVEGPAPINVSELSPPGEERAPNIARGLSLVP
jgi:hypothetical protein